MTASTSPRRSANAIRSPAAASLQGSPDRESLRELLARDGDGRRSCVPIFGTGLNIQAATLAGYPQKDDWRELLVKIAARVFPSGRSIDSLPREHLSLWEALLCRWARHTRVYPFKAESELQSFICEELREQETECRSFALYRQIADAGFSDILSLNFDRRVAMSIPRASFDAGPSPSPLGSHGESVFRHSVIPLETGGVTKVWYPHGDVKKAATIKFGVRKYGFYVAVLSEYVLQRGGAWRYRDSSVKHLAKPAAKAALLRKTPAWIPIFLSRQLVFIGCGLSLQEWPLWWLLRHRLRLGAPPAVCLVLSKSGPPPHLKSRPEVRTIVFESPAELWDTFLAALSEDSGPRA